MTLIKKKSPAKLLTQVRSGCDRKAVDLVIQPGLLACSLHIRMTVSTFPACIGGMLTSVNVFFLKHTPRNLACVAANLNASLNGVEIETTSKNLLENPARNYGCSFDVILLGDLLYDDEMAESLIPWLEETVRENRSRVYLGDPGRHALTDTLKRRMEFKQEYSLPGNVRRENYGYDSAAVWQFKID
ncbi:electron transfer flavoprotein beta subunit lysine methyltransferase-like isoform X4 [Venturia canescens]|uniref:electron transfer flavoprotein beta subunit lysine methyltransferase-like isoform X4 n=1 Tax=Venturia canescens TaxID=32260 RepID=UPI001C9CB762|nr:electron transfer flavoprotein beta subunit lysine methyltransferase-like isoform X4 [Venturia canescens]